MEQKRKFKQPAVDFNRSKIAKLPLHSSRNSPSHSIDPAPPAGSAAAAVPTPTTVPDATPVPAPATVDDAAPTTPAPSLAATTGTPAPSPAATTGKKQPPITKADMDTFVAGFEKEWCQS
jgi:hypothetical protein